MTQKLVVYRLDMAAAMVYFANLRGGSWYHPSPAERRIITGVTHDDYVGTIVINGNLAGSIPRRLLIETDEDMDEVIAQYEATGRSVGFSVLIEAARRAK